MKWIITILSVLSLNLLMADRVDIPQNETREMFEHRSTGLAETEISFALDGYELEEVSVGEAVYQKISYWNEGKFVDEGKPDLPRFTRMYAIPNVGNVSLEITSMAEEVIAGIQVYPTQKLRSESEPYDETFNLDEKFYRGSKCFPEQIVEIGQPVIFRDIRLVTVTINAFQYQPEDSSLRIITNLDLAIRTDNDLNCTNPKTSDRKLSRSFEKIYQAVVQNYDEVAANREDVYQDPCYLFIYPEVNQLRENLEYITDWKEQMGYEVHAVPTTETGISTSQIKNYIENAYNNWENPPEYVCFIGDANGAIAIPTYYETVSSYGGEGDHPYSQLEGNDILADIITGRISVSTINELQVYASKVLHYERAPFMNVTNWYHRGVMVGDPSSSEWSVVYTKQFIKEMIDYHAPNIVCDQYYNGNYCSNMVNSLNNGVLYFNYRGFYGMSNFTTSEINSLMNGFMLPFAAFLTCSTGSFASSSPARSEAFIRVGSTSNGNGAIAAIGTATSGTHTTFNNCVDAGIYYGIFADQIYNPGGAVVRGKLHLYNSFPDNPNNRVTMFSHWNTLMGDPGIQLWTDLPTPLIVDYDQEVNVGTNYLLVSVYDDAGIPVENAWVCALKDDQIFERGYTDMHGNVYLTMDTSATGTVGLTVTCHNYIPHLGSFEIVESDGFANIAAYTLDDDNNGTSAGNGDGTINPGETIELNVGLQNFGTQTIDAVTATLSSASEYVTITDDAETYGSIASGSVVYSDDDFDFTVAPNTLGGTELQFDMLIEDGNGSQWQDHLFLPVAGANLYVSAYEVADTNGILDPGDSVQVIVTLFNTGSITAPGMEGLLSCEHAYITLIDSTAVFGDIQPGEEANNDDDRFEVGLNSHAISGAQIPFSILLTNAAGFEQTVTFLIDVGTVTSNDPLGPDSYGYYAYDSTDDIYEQAPIYDWIEIDPSYGGSGTVIALVDPGDTGDVEDVDVPFNFNFYGMNYDMISVCSNGWIAPGGSEQASFMNTQLPAPQGPSPMIAPFWDDLIVGTGHVCYFYDTLRQAFIVEWSRVHSDFDLSEQTFEVIIYNPEAYHTTSGDAEIVFQYKTVHNTSAGSYSGYSIQHGQYSSVGLEDHTGLRGLEYTYNNTYPLAAAPLANELAIKFTTTGGSAQAPPIIGLNQTSMDFVLYPGSNDSQTLQITNSGEANLIYSLEKSYVGYGSDNSRGHGGPDNFGYQWFDSDEANGPQYNWRDISGLATEVTFPGENTATELMPIGFNFYFYGDYYSEFRISPNGWIGFGEDSEYSNNLSLPHPWAPKPGIIPFWDDLDPLSSGSVSYYSTTDSLIVWFNDVPHTSGNYTGVYDFEIMLYTNGDIIFQYREMTGDTDSATIGVQNGEANDALQIIY
nr:C25 family cysteine peptidase [Candidatus Cloacimonadota bacterium]